MTKKDLSKVQKETLILLNKGYSVGMIAFTRKVTASAVYKTLRILDRKGYIKYGGKNWGSTSSFSIPIRLHALQYQIKLIYSSPVYFRLLKNSNMLEFNDFKVRLYKDSMTLWINKDFISSSAVLCKEKATDHLKAVLRFLERKLSITVLKRGYKNIKLVNSHYARVGDEIAKKTNEDGSRIYLKDSVDDKPWLITDKSLKIAELETVHPKTAYRDMREIIEPLFRTLKDNPNILGQLQTTQRDLAKSQLITQNQVLAISKLLRGLLGKAQPSENPQDPGDPPDYIG
jgi:hypothetical protein